MDFIQAMHMFYLADTMQTKLDEANQILNDKARVLVPAKSLCWLDSVCMLLLLLFLLFLFIIRINETYEMEEQKTIEVKHLKYD